VAEIGTKGALGALLSDMDRLLLAESQPGADASLPRAGGGIGYDPRRAVPNPDNEVDDALPILARSLRARAGADVALAMRVTPRGEDSAVEIALETPIGSQHERRLAFLRGTMGRHRAAITAAALLLERLPKAPVSA
jgi:hypothetical protein